MYIYHARINTLSRLILGRTSNNNNYYSFKILPPVKTHKLILLYNNTNAKTKKVTSCFTPSQPLRLYQGDCKETLLS